MAKSAISIVSDRIRTSLENGTIPWRNPWIGSPVHGAYSYASGKEYSFLNQMFLAPGEYITFNQAKKAGGSVKKGAKANEVVFWTKLCYDGNGEIVDKASEAVTTIPFLRYYNVFHINDCENVTPHEGMAVTEETLYQGVTLIEECENVINDYVARENITLNRDDVTVNAFYLRQSDTITCPNYRQYNSVNAYYSTIFHELAHSTGAEGRLNRKFGSTKRSPLKPCDDQYAFEELVAEITAVALMNKFRLDTTGCFDNSAAYINAYFKFLEKNERLFIKACSCAEKAFHYILNDKNEEE